MASLLRRFRVGRDVQLASTTTVTATNKLQLATGAAAAVKLLKSGPFVYGGVPAPRNTTGHALVRHGLLHRAGGGIFSSPIRCVHRDGGARPGVGRSTAVIAIGSNQGDSVDLFRQALKALKDAGIEGACCLTLHYIFVCFPPRQSRGRRRPFSRSLGILRRNPIHRITTSAPKPSLCVRPHEGMRVSRPGVSQSSHHVAK